MTDHSVTFDHSPCDHDNPVGCWRPIVATFTCDAPEDADCRYGCEDDSCIESGWRDIGFLRLWCEKGHRLTQHSCWVEDWVTNVWVEDAYADEVHGVLTDGPIEIVNWTDEFLTWRRVEAS